MATEHAERNQFYTETTEERAARAARGFETRQPPLAASAPYANVDRVAERRLMATALPPGRALDDEHLAVLLDSGNETAPARVLRRKLCEHAIRQVRAELVLTAAELETVRAFIAQPDPLGATRAPIREWPSSS